MFYWDLSGIYLWIRLRLWVWRMKTAEVKRPSRYTTSRAHAVTMTVPLVLTLITWPESCLSGFSTVHSFSFPFPSYALWIIYFLKVCFPFLNHCLSPPRQLGQCGGQGVLVTWCENTVETCSLAVFEISSRKLLGAPVSSHLQLFKKNTSLIKGAIGKRAQARAAREEQCEEGEGLLSCCPVSSIRIQLP